MTDPTIDHRLFPALYTDGERYYTVSDGQVWRWVYVSDGLFGLNPRKAHWVCTPREKNAGRRALRLQGARWPTGCREAQRR